MNNTITEQHTEAGRRVEHDSFAIIDREVGSHAYTDEEWPIVRRMIHATADFDFNGRTRFHPSAVAAGKAALAAGANLIADVEMIVAGVSKPRLTHFGVTPYHFISDPDVIKAAKAKGSTRAIQAMRKAHGLGLLEGAILGIGNAPTALLEIVRLIREEGARPALVLGMPVGFVSATASKNAMALIEQVPWIVTDGRKGGSPLVVAAIHALLGLCETGS